MRRYLITRFINNYVAVIIRRSGYECVTNDSRRHLSFPYLSFYSFLTFLVFRFLPFPSCILSLLPTFIPFFIYAFLPSSQLFFFTTFIPSSLPYTFQLSSCSSYLSFVLPSRSIADGICAFITLLFFLVVLLSSASLFACSSCAFSSSIRES